MAGEEWIMCLIYKDWAHVVCFSVEKSEYMCHFCMRNLFVTEKCALYLPHSVVCLILSLL
jgi:hypothetical protein